MAAAGWFFNIPTHGHINPTLPLVQGLVEGGDRITYFAGPTFAEKIEATGASYGTYGAGYTFEQSRTEAHAVLQGSQLAEATRALLPGLLEKLEADRPDYLLFDMSAPWGNIIAQRFDIPAVASFPHLPFNWRAFFSDTRLLKKGLHSLRPGQGHYRELQRQMRALAREYDLKRPSEINVLSSSAELNLVFSTRTFQPYAESLDESYQFVGPVINSARPDESWSFERQRGQKLIYIAVGTLYQADLRFFQQCFDAFGDGPQAVILSVGKAVDPADLGDIPSNFTVAQYVPQLTILDAADLFITHGGMNSINEAVMATVPMVVVPNTIEQALNGARVEQLKAGLYLEPQRVDGNTLRQSAAQVMNGEGFLEGLQKIKESFLAAGGVPKAIEAINALKRRHGIN
jgi:MGT family glycosyltransferase